MAVVRGVAVVFDVGPEQCGAVELYIEDGAGELRARYVQEPHVCDQPPHLIWLGKVGLCEGHVLRMWPELGVPS